MSYRAPTSRKSKKKQEGLNLIPILDAVFIFIFFLLMSTQFIKIFEIGSDVPILSDSPPPKNQKKPLALTVEIRNNRLDIFTGVPSKAYKTIRNKDGQYDLLALHETLVKIKGKHVKEESIILEPRSKDLTYEQMVQLMDAVRTLNNTDGPFFKKDKDGIDVQVKTLFSKIVFGNLLD